MPQRLSAFSAVIVSLFVGVGGAALASHPCAGCHPAETGSQVETSMAHALTPAPLSEVLRAHQQLSFASGGAEYRIERSANEVVYSVKRGAEVFSTPIQWAFGVGNTGQTYVYMKDGAFYEARVSFYRSLDGLNITNGHYQLPTTTIGEAAGRLISDQELSRCFGCHTTTSPSGLFAGIQCVACHEQSEEHALSFLKGGKPVKVASLKQLNASQLLNFCGRCHGAFDAGSAPKGVYNVRYQPYRLMSSRCFDSSDSRIGCTACHNPHEEVRKAAGFYDAKCEACHAPRATTTTAVKLCPVAKQNCTSCHMPKVALPEMHASFTDHRIRVVRKGEAYPE